LRSAASLQDIWFTPDPVPREHLWAEMTAGLPGAGIPIPRFGASDCRCRSRLFHFASKPVFASFRRWALQQLSASVSIMAFSATVPRQARRNAL
ncbi:MAG: hypothetical protein MUC57_14005, partial [Desulfobacterales bacterium]|nr:hypothetical protein [Desulfobacterales bacterium]